MTQQLRPLLALLLFGGSWLAGCGGSDKEDNPAPTPAPNKLLTERTAFLTQSVWIQTGSTSTETASGVTNHYNFFPLAPRCMTDNTTAFHKDNTYVLEEGQTRCEPTDPQVLGTGTWALKADGSELSFTNKQGSESRWKIVRFTASEHTLTRTVVINGHDITRIDTIIYHTL